MHEFDRHGEGHRRFSPPAHRFRRREGEERAQPLSTRKDQMSHGTAQGLGQPDMDGEAGLDLRVDPRNPLGHVGIDIH